MADDRDFWSDDEWGDYDEGGQPPDDLFTDADPGDPTLQEIVEALGRSSEIDFLVNLRDIEDASLIRASRFTSLEDAIYFLYDIGVGSFSDVIELELNVYAVVIPENTPKGT